MSLYASRRCLDAVGRVAGSSSSLSRSWSATLVFQHRCYAARATAQKLKEKPAVNAAAPPSTARAAGKAVDPKKAAEEATASERTTEDELKAIEALHRMTETNEVDISSAPLELLGESHWPVLPSQLSSPGNMRRVYIRPIHFHLQAEVHMIYTVVHRLSAGQPSQSGVYLHGSVYVYSLLCASTYATVPFHDRRCAVSYIVLTTCRSSCPHLEVVERGCHNPRPPPGRTSDTAKLAAQCTGVRSPHLEFRLFGDSYLTECTELRRRGQYPV